jgi:hypothetical protein
MPRADIDQSVLRKAGEESETRSESTLTASLSQPFQSQVTTILERVITILSPRSLHDESSPPQRRAAERGR